MWLELAHPEIAGLSCDTCEKYMVVVEGTKVTGRLVYWPAGTKQPMKRPANSSPPCTMCPKCEGLKPEYKNPANGRKATLSPKNHKMVQAYFEIQAAAGAPGGEVDSVTRRGIGIVHQIMTEYERTQSQITIELLKQLRARH